MNGNKPAVEGPRPAPSRPRLSPNSILLMLVVLALLVFLYFGRSSVNRTEISYDFFWKQLQAGNISEVEFEEHQLLGRFHTRPEAPPRSVGCHELGRAVVGRRRHRTQSPRPVD